MLLCYVLKLLCSHKHVTDERTDRFLVFGFGPKFDAYLRFWYKDHSFFYIVVFWSGSTHEHRQRNRTSNLTDLVQKFETYLQFLSKVITPNFIHVDCCVCELSCSQAHTDRQTSACSHRHIIPKMLFFEFLEV